MLEHYGLERIKELAAQIGVNLDTIQISQLLRHAQLLEGTNSAINLTSIEPALYGEAHFIDSLCALPFIPTHCANLIDVGSGAGFVGLPLAVARPDLAVTLVESIAKKERFIAQAIEALNLENASTLNARAEEIAHNDRYREVFDVATARAVAALPVLVELLLPLVRVGGTMIALKSQDIEEEIQQAYELVEALGGAELVCSDYLLPSSQTPRAIVTIKKISSTPTRFPRRTSRLGSDL